MRGTRTAKDVMTPEVLAVRVDTSVRELTSFLAENQITGAPVLDRHGHLVGVVSLTDVAESDADSTGVVGDRSSPDFDVRGWEDRMTSDEVRQLHVERADRAVGDIMTPAVYSVSEDTPVSLMAKTMIAGRIHRLFVTRGKHVVGIVTSLDLLKLLVEDV